MFKKMERYPKEPGSFIRREVAPGQAIHEYYKKVNGLVIRCWRNEYDFEMDFTEVILPYKEIPIIEWSNKALL